MPRRFLQLFPTCLMALGLLSSGCKRADPVAPARADLRDILIAGSPDAGHRLAGRQSIRKPGGLAEPAIHLLPGSSPSWQGGSLAFTLRIDPKHQNYFTIRLWGGDVNHNQLTLLVEGKQIGYRHLGDIEALDIGTDAPAYPGRFCYRTCPLPLALTTGKSELACEIRASGPIWGYGKDFAKYQQPMTEPSRGIYGIYCHTDPCFIPPAGEKQGSYPDNAPVRAKPGPEVIAAVKARVNGVIDGLLKDPAKPCNQMQALFLARAYHVRWTHAAGRPETVRKVMASLDNLYRAYVAKPDLAREEPSSYNPDWFGLGPCGQIIDLLHRELRPHLDETIDDGTGKQVNRRDGFRDMLVACRDIHRKNRRQYTNQTMIMDLYGIYLANRGLAIVAPAAALPEDAARRYLHEAIGLKPWLGPEIDGKPTKPLGDGFFQITTKGLSRELGFVGTYGEVIDWVTQIYDATRPAPGLPGDPEILRQLARIATARGPFRYPMLDADGHRAMVMETITGWRDTHFPGDVTYAQRPTWDGSPFEAAAATLDPQLIGWSQQMLADNQFHASVARRMENTTFRVTSGLIGIPDSLDTIKAQGPQAHRMPMSWDQPDFVFTDEENGVVAIKNGKEILYASLYWRARHAVNFLGRVHYLTPTMDRVATVAIDIKFTPSGMDYTRPDWTNFGFGNGGPRYPAGVSSAHAGEKLPIARIPAGVPFAAGKENMFAGRGDYYQLRYGPYLIAMNMSTEKSFALAVPAHDGSIVDLVSRRPLAAGSTLTIAPLTTAIIHFAQPDN